MNAQFSAEPGATRPPRGRRQSPGVADGERHTIDGSLYAQYRIICAMVAKLPVFALRCGNGQALAAISSAG